MVEPHIDTERPETPEEFAEMLEDAGMPEKRALVYAHYDYGYTNSEIADKLGNERPTIGTHYDLADDDIADAEQLVHYTLNPNYLKELPRAVGEALDNQIEHYVCFRLHRPRLTDDGLYSLDDADVLEGHHIDDQTCLLKFHTKGGVSGEKRYYALKQKYIPVFIHDWIVPGRYHFTYQYDREDYSDEWFFTDGFEPEWLEGALENLGIERVEVLTDDRFTNPLDEPAVLVDETAPTGQYHGGYRVGYTPTDAEILSLFEKGDLSEQEVVDLIGEKPSDL